MVKLENREVSFSVPERNGKANIRQSLSSLVQEMCLTDKRFGVDLASVRIAKEINTICENAKDEESFELSDSQYRIMCEVFKNPSGGYTPLIAVHTLPLIEYFLKPTAEAAAKAPGTKG